MPPIAGPKVKPRMGRKRSDQHVLIAGEPFHIRLKRLLDARRGDRSYSDLAEATGIDKRVISRILTGKVMDIQLGTLMALLESVGANLCHLHRAEKNPD